MNDQFRPDVKLDCWFAVSIMTRAKRLNFDCDLGLSAGRIATSFFCCQTIKSIQYAVSEVWVGMMHLLKLYSSFRFHILLLLDRLYSCHHLLSLHEMTNTFQ